MSNNCPDEKYLQSGKYVFIGSSEQGCRENFRRNMYLESLRSSQEINVALLKGLSILYHQRAGTKWCESAGAEWETDSLCIRGYGELGYGARNFKAV